MAGKTTIYLPDDLKRALEHEARRVGTSEAEVIRQAIWQALGQRRPRGGLYEGEPIAARADELLNGFDDGRSSPRGRDCFPLAT